MTSRPNNKGFTLIEIMVALVMAGIAIASIYSAYLSQHKSYVVQEQVTGMQQNLRVAMYMIGREIRVAGCRPIHGTAAGILTADPDSIRVTMDITGGETDGIDNDGDGFTDESDEDRFGDGDVGDTGEDITYLLYDSEGDGDNDLGRKVGAGSPQPIAENIDVLNFVYLSGNGTETAVLSAIRSVQVTIVARTEREDPNYDNTTVYRNQQGNEIYSANDHFRRRLLTTQLKCRNIGL